MSFNWSEYLKFGQEARRKVSEFSNEEAVYRSVVSRAYYASFCTIRDLVERHDKQKFTTSEHDHLADYLRRHTDKRRKSLGNRLKTLRDYRVKADYHGNCGSALSLSGQALKTAQQIETEVQNIWKR